jgi:hypothetical protein
MVEQSGGSVIVYAGDEVIIKNHSSTNKSQISRIKFIQAVEL